MEDAVIICGSSVSQVKANVDACRDETPLPKVNIPYDLQYVTHNRTKTTDNVIVLNLACIKMRSVSG